ncbi:MAG: LysM peptidoglycan-binding domain-containing protein [Limisphaerales bacterium]
MLLLSVAVGLNAGQLAACGPDFPNNLLDDGGTAVLAAPKTDFYRELDRLHLAPARFHAVLATNSYAEQNIAFEQADLLAAFRKAGTNDLDAVQIAAAHLAERMKLQQFIASLKQWSNSVPDNWDMDAQRYVRGQPNIQPPAFPVIDVVAGLPDEFADYFDGAIAWNNPLALDKTMCRQMWNQLLELPPEQRHFKSVAATFMLGKAWAQEDPDKAAGYFQQTRALAKRGFADSNGLAAASFGEEARLVLRQKKFIPAINLYLEQLGTGDLTAANSLRFAAAQALTSDDPDVLNQLANDVQARRVITAFLISRCSSLSIDTDMAANKWLVAVEAANVREVESAEEFALAAYQIGEWDLAQRWIDRAPNTPTTQWLQVKLLLRAGKTDDAATLLASVSRNFPVTSSETTAQRDEVQMNEHYQRQNNLPLESPYTNGPVTLVDDLTVARYSYYPGGVNAPSQMLGELGVLHLTRREYTEALDALLRAGFWMDAAYVAERVLTVGELKAYVDDNWPEADASHDSIDQSNSATFENGSFNLRREIRYLLARRLTRMERSGEAGGYYPVEWRAAQANLIQQLAIGRNESLPSLQRFYALVAAAWITRTNGMELIGTEVEPDWHIYDGGFDYGLTVASRKTGLLPASDEELSRSVQNNVMPEKRFHYRHQATALKQEAAKQGWEAAKLLPDNSDKAAQILCLSGAWLNPKPAGAYYRAILQRFRQTEIGRETARIGGFPKLDENGRVIRRQLNAEDVPTSGKTYVIHAGDTLFHIAEIASQSGPPMTVADLLLANPKLKTDKIRAGQMIDIPNPSQSEPGQSLEKTPAEAQPAADPNVQSMSGQTYVIQSGDSLAKIAQAVSSYGWQLSVQDILQANPGLTASRLKIGQVIVIPTPKN